MQNYKSVKVKVSPCLAECPHHPGHHNYHHLLLGLPDTDVIGNDQTFMGSGLVIVTRIIPVKMWSMVSLQRVTLVGTSLGLLYKGVEMGMIVIVGMIIVIVGMMIVKS